MLEPNKHLVSICIPAYKNTSFLERLLASLLIQTYTNFEVIISDDSPDDIVKDFIIQYKDKLRIFYFKNNPSLGTPANWNFAMNQAKGEFIKLIHDDDWLANEHSLNLMVDALLKNEHADFVFSAYSNVDVETNNSFSVIANLKSIELIKINPLNLFRSNVIGPPSVIMHRRKFDFEYDEKLKWVVDFEGYMRCLQKGSYFVYLPEPLINVGVSSVQVTKTSSRIREVEIPENFYMLLKQGLHILNNIWVFDYYWRLLRNVGIRREKDIMAATWKEEIPKVLKRMIWWQRTLPIKTLNVGIISKTIMFICFISTIKIGKLVPNS